MWKRRKLAARAPLPVASVARFGQCRTCPPFHRAGVMSGCVAFESQSSCADRGRLNPDARFLQGSPSHPTRFNSFPVVQRHVGSAARPPGCQQRQSQTVYESYSLSILRLLFPFSTDHARTRGRRSNQSAQESKGVENRCELHGKMG
ncbi:hypothetical protein DFH94DRAFT_846256 [Russula ochroleuca]|uniref:Uncharacterized protein n=1 Tax=Russula ochroleuca TaxID=152965 RepID=A0A9P5T5F4_9AGAM|nr:hypothetical protein DFH94DRAFT_846256 [Russula ochroleuca]